MAPTSKLDIRVTCDDEGRVHVRGVLDRGEAPEKREDPKVDDTWVFSVNPLLLIGCGDPMVPPRPNKCPPKSLILELQRNKTGHYDLTGARPGGERGGPRPGSPVPKPTPRPRTIKT